MPGIRIGLIGLGRHGMRYAQHMRELAPRATLVAVCRRDALQGAAFADTHGLRFHNDFRALIADPHVDAVVVVTPPSLTSVICGEAIRANKPLLIEKPLAMSGAVARTMAEAVGVERVIAAVDSRGGHVAIHGWRTVLPITAVDASSR